MVSAGAEVIADGNIHVYAPLRGRALAGASGDKAAASSPPAWKPNWFPWPACTAPSSPACRPTSPASRPPCRWSAMASSSACTSPPWRSGKIYPIPITPQREPNVTRIITVTSGKGGSARRRPAPLLHRPRHPRLQDSRHRLRRRPAHLDLIMGCERAVVVRPDQRHQRRSHPEPGADQGQALRQPVRARGLANPRQGCTQGRRVEQVFQDLARDGFDYIVCDSPAGIEPAR